MEAIIDSRKVCKWIDGIDTEGNKLFRTSCGVPVPTGFRFHTFCYNCGKPVDLKTSPYRLP